MSFIIGYLSALQTFAFAFYKAMQLSGKSTMLILIWIMRPNNYHIHIA